MSNQVALVGMIPKPANIVDQFAIVVDQGGVNREDTVLAIAGGWVVLEPFKALPIQVIRIPRRLSQEAVEARLVRCIRKLACDATDGLVLSYQ